MNEDLHTDAMIACRAIYFDYHVSQLRELQDCIKKAWEIGRQCDILIKESIEIRRE